jgi:hypothetical protein
MHKVISSTSYSTSLPDINNKINNNFNNNQSNFMNKSKIVQVVDYYNLKNKMMTSQTNEKEIHFINNNDNGEILNINYKQVYFNKNKLANFNNKLTLDNNKCTQKLAPLKNKDDPMVNSKNSNQKKKAKKSSDNLIDSDIIMDLIEKKKTTLDPIQHAKLAFYESLLSKNSAKKNNATIRNYKTYDLFTNNNIDLSGENSLNEFVESSVDFSNGKLKAATNLHGIKKGVSINHFSKFENISLPRKNTQLNPINMNSTMNNIINSSSTSSSTTNNNILNSGADYSTNRLAIIPEISEVKDFSTDSKCSDDIDHSLTKYNNKKSNLSRKKITSLSMNHKSSNKTFGFNGMDKQNLNLNSHCTSLPKIIKNQDDKPTSKRNKLETSITFPNYNSKTLLDKFNLNIKIEGAFKYTKLLDDRTHQSSLDTIKLKFPNFSSTIYDDSHHYLASDDQTSQSRKFDSNSNDYFDL